MKAQAIPRLSTTCTSVFSTRLVGGPNSSVALPAFNIAPCECGRLCPKHVVVTPSPLPPALIISASNRCFARARDEVQRGGFESAERIAADFVEENSTVAMCCKGGKCGRGRRSKPSHRARVDGVARAHRKAWSEILRSNRAGVVFEDDIEAIGTVDDVRYAIDRCRRAPCDIAFLGVGLASMLLSHSYYITPRAAGKLLKVTKDFCNEVGQDYSIQKLCVQRRVQCELPPRGLLPAPSVGTQGWGLFVQNNRAVPSYNLLLNNARGHSWNWSVAAAERFTHHRRC